MIYDIGVIGLGVMGTNIAKNMSRKGFKVVTFDFFEDVRKNRLNELKQADDDVAETYESLADNLKQSRMILMLEEAGEATDRTIDEVAPRLEKGDTLIHGVDEQYENTRRRNIELTKKEIN